jgi:hypothetical protein
LDPIRWHQRVSRQRTARFRSDVGVGPLGETGQVNLDVVHYCPHATYPLRGTFSR